MGLEKGMVNDMEAFECDQMELLMERLELTAVGIENLLNECNCEQQYHNYFMQCAGFAKLILEEFAFVSSGAIYEAAIDELAERNHKIYEQILPENYDKCYANPVLAIAEFGKEQGQLLAFLAAELRGMIGPVYEKDLEGVVIRLELLLEIYQLFVCAKEEEMVISNKSLQQILYWYVSDYSETRTEKRTRDLVEPEGNFAVGIIKDADLSDLRYLYYYGEYIEPNQIETAKHLMGMSMEQIELMANTYTEGYRMGFEITGRDLSKKRSVDIRYMVGMERMMRKAVENFAKMGLRCQAFRAGSSIFTGHSVAKNGFYGGSANKQFDFDHREDLALFMDSLLANRKLECLKASYETYKTQALTYAGPAVVETFGEENFVPVTDNGAPAYSQEQQEHSVEYASKAGQITNQYIPGEERSFTIIAFPVPEIGPDYAEIFDETVRINTLNYKLYQGIQQKIIDTLDQGSYVIVKGSGENQTDLTIQLHQLTNPDKETNFENCVADVNIPVGEVFTSPVLKGTNGLLHVTSVFLNGLEYKDLKIWLKDGMITDYSCANYEKEAENKKMIKDNVLYHHETLPIGEFAIGTNTTAYVVAKKFHIEDKLPILIAEKTGPHFAFGDTCYSHAEDVVVYNPDGKEIIARDNEKSILRKTDVSKAYFNCHTDVTIPYDELGLLAVITKEQESISIIENGKFTLPGCEELNEAFQIDD